MEIFEKINYILNEKDIAKKDFVRRLINLQPILKTTGETPTEQTIYRYLNGKREVKIELIPYIAEVLEVDEQELFKFDIEYATEHNMRYSKDAREILELLNYAPKPVIEHIKVVLRRFKSDCESAIQDIN